MKVKQTEKPLPLKEYTKTVKMKNKGKDFTVEFMNIPYTDEQILNFEAVKRGLFTGYELTGFINCYGINLYSLFDVIDNLKGAEKIDKLNELKTQYQDKFSFSQSHTPFHHRKKLFAFIDKEIRETQKDYFSNIESKPLILKDMATIYGCSVKHLSKRIKELTKEGKFVKQEKGRHYSVPDLKLLGKLLGCSFSIKNGNKGK